MPSKFFALLSLCMFVFCCAIAPASAASRKQAAIPAEDTKSLKANISQKVSVVGTVLSANKSSKDGLRFLNFTDNTKTGFIAALVPAVYSKFPDFETLAGKRMRVTGILETYKDKTVIKVSRPKQIKILKMPKAPKSPNKKSPL